MTTAKQTKATAKQRFCKVSILEYRLNRLGEDWIIYGEAIPELSAISAAEKLESDGFETRIFSILLATDTAIELGAKQIDIGERLSEMRFGELAGSLIAASIPSN